MVVPIRTDFVSFARRVDNLFKLHYFHPIVCLTRCRFALVVILDWREPMGSCSVHSVGITAELRLLGALALFLLAPMAQIAL